MMIACGIIIYGALFTALVTALYRFLAFPRCVPRTVSIGKIFGGLSLFLAIETILCSRIAISGAWWIYGIQMPLIFAGLSGFFRNSRLPAITLILITLFLMYDLSIIAPDLMQSTDGPSISLPEPPDPIADGIRVLEALPPPPPPSLWERLLTPIGIFVHSVFFGWVGFHPIIDYGVPYLIAIAGLVSSIMRNRHGNSIQPDG